MQTKSSTPYTGGSYKRDNYTGDFKKYPYRDNNRDEIKDAPHEGYRGGRFSYRDNRQPYRPNFKEYRENRDNRGTKDVKEKQVPQVPNRSENIVMVSNKRPPTFYVFLVKQIFNEGKFDMIELHGAGDVSINSVAKAAGILTNYHYGTISKIKTKTLQGKDTKVGKLVIHLTKSSDFTEVYQKFEVVRAEKREKFAEGKAVKESEDDTKEPTEKKVTSPEKGDTKSQGSASETSPKHQD